MPEETEKWISAAKLKSMSISIDTLTPEQVGAIRVPVLVSVGTKDPVAGDPHALAALIPGARAFDIPGRDHNLAVGDRSHREAVLAFLKERP